MARYRVLVSGREFRDPLENRAMDGQIFLAEYFVEAVSAELAEEIAFGLWDQDPRYQNVAWGITAKKAFRVSG